MMKMRFAALTACALCLTSVTAYECFTDMPEVCFAEEVKYYETGTDGKQSYNSYKNTYSASASPVNSYLISNGNHAFTRVEYNTDSGNLITEKYDNGKIVSANEIKMELPLWGGFYNGSKYYFCVFGQTNEKESDKTEVLRIVKYDKNWNRISSCSVYGANTQQPFRAGSLRMDESGSLLCIHTCHTMYKLASDGLNHQANMTYVLDEEKMSVKQQFYTIYNISKGYCSHSFNQFVKTDGNTLYRVDHGDGHPRSVVLTKATLDNITKCSNTDILSISGTAGDNYTGVTVGGFELSDSNCIVTGSTTDQKNFSVSNQKNIFVGIAGKSSMKSNCIYLTSYGENSEITVNTPKLVKINSNKFVVMWEEYSECRNYTMFSVIDGSGKVLVKPKKLNVRLSDCQPVTDDYGNIVWYVTNSESPVIYTLNPDDTDMLMSSFTWNYDSESKTLTVSGDGSVWLYDMFDHPWDQVKNEIENLVVEEGITAISQDAFCRLKYLKNVQLPESLTFIGQRAFENCTSLKQINIPDGVVRIENSAFYGTTSLKVVELGEGVERIGSQAFGYADGSDGDVLYKGLVMYGTADSETEKYASENEIEFRDRTVSETAGDLNSDGILSLADIMEMKKVIIDGQYVKCADLDSDGTVSISDLIRMNEIFKR